ncbi:Os12g0454701, partial [Oryza sativa Japonica Group]
QNCQPHPNSYPQQPHAGSAPAALPLRQVAGGAGAGAGDARAHARPVGRRREDARLRRRRRVREVRRQAAAVGDLDLEPHPFLALRAVAGFGEEVVGALDGERDGDGGGARGRRRRVAVAGAVDEGLRALGVAERVGGGVRRLNHRRAVVRLEDW